RAIPPEPVREPAPTKEEEEIADRLHQHADLRAREAVPVPKVSVPVGPGRDRGRAGPLERAGYNLVPKSAREAQARHGGAQEGRRDGQGAVRAQDLPRERQRHEHPEEEDHARGQPQPAE
ncbi:hypothetical protein pipiens_000353, partial [Culex pipiens pipiens]